ncbi:MAG: phospholipase D-like domain-containing protein [Patescibacteria group bacterium]|jgi:phosphatidylserine/phosphatidylglycerophosphate/cardiolipin synthase-like enzyme
MKFKQKKFGRIFFYFLVFLAALFVLAVLTRELGRRLSGFIIASDQPARTIETSQPVVADIFFSNEPDTNGVKLSSADFLKLITTEIDQAKKTLEIAVYSVKSASIKEAIYRAARRGVKVTLILDFRKAAIHNQFFYDLPPEIKRLDLGSDSLSLNDVTLMHHKFAIIDRGAANEKLIFGSFNWTELQAVYDRSYILVTANHELVASFGREFERLVRGEGEKNKLANVNYHPWDLNMKTGAYAYEVWFGPGWTENGFNKRISDLLKEAKSNIKIMIWDFTDSSLAKEILSRARAGLKVTILADNFNFYSTSSVFQLLNKIKAEEKLTTLEILNDVAFSPPAYSTRTINGDAELDPFLHYHVLIIDDKKILFGTNNWSRGGSYSNDEAVMVSDDPKIISRFLDSFSYNYQINKNYVSR